MILVVGATGVLGGLVTASLVDQGERVRALVRRTADPEKVRALRDRGVELVEGDLKVRGSLDEACRGVKAIVSTATAIVSRQPDDTLQNVDEQGHLSLIEAGESARVEQFVFASFHEHGPDFPLQRAKRAVEARLRSSSIAHTILRPGVFLEGWLGPALWPVHGVDFANARAKFAGTGDQRLSWISIADVVRFVIGSLDNPSAKNATFELGGPDAMSPREVIALFERIMGARFDVEYIPESALSAQFESASDPFSKSFAGLLLSFASGYTADSSAALEAIPVTRGRIAAHAERSLRFMKS